MIKSDNEVAREYDLFYKSIVKIDDFVYLSVREVSDLGFSGYVKYIVVEDKNALFGLDEKYFSKIRRKEDKLVFFALEDYLITNKILAHLKIKHRLTAGLMPFFEFQQIKQNCPPYVKPSISGLIYEDLNMLLAILELETGIDSKYWGFNNSMLLGFYSEKESDFDLDLLGEENCGRLIKGFNAVLNKENVLPYNYSDREFLDRRKRELSYLSLQKLTEKESKVFQFRYKGKSGCRHVRIDTYFHDPTKFNVLDKKFLGSNYFEAEIIDDKFGRMTPAVYGLRITGEEKGLARPVYLVGYLFTGLLKKGERVGFNGSLYQGNLFDIISVSDGLTLEGHNISFLNP